MQQKKIVFILRNICGGGAERTTLNLLRHLSIVENYDITLYLLENQGVYWDEIPENIRVEKAVSKINYTISYIKIFFKALLFCKDYDLIVSAIEGFPTYLGVLVAKLLRKKHISWARTCLEVIYANKPFYYNIFPILAYKMTDYIVGVSNGVAENIKAIYNIKTPAKHIYNIFDKNLIDDLSYDEGEQKLKSIIGDNYICAIGRLDGQKGFDALIKAFCTVKYEYGRQEKLIIFGDGIERQSLSNLIIKLNLENDVFLPGFCKNAFFYLKDAKLFVLSSRVEGLSNVLLESLYLEVPIVTTNCPFGPEELLHDCLSEYFCQVDDSEEMAKKINFALTNYSMAKDRIVMARSKLNNFLPEVIISEWVGVFELLGIK